MTALEDLYTSSMVGDFSARGSIENPSTDWRDPSFWESMDAFGGGGTSASGQSVTPQKSMSIAAVWQCVGMISGKVAMLPLDVYRRTEDGREVDRKHASQRLVRKKPNDEQHAFRFWQTLMVHVLIWGNGYAWIERNGVGQPLSLIPLLPDRTNMERRDGKLYCVTETSLKADDGSTIPWLQAIPHEDVLHIAGLSFDGTTGAEMVKHARDAWGLALAAQNFNSKFFRHGVRSSGLLKMPLGSSPKFQTNVEEGFKKYQGEDGWFKTVVLRDGVDFMQTSFNAQESQMTETREESVREVARYFNMQPSRLGLRDSVSYNSKAEDNQDYLDTTLSPWLHEIQSECNCKLLSLNQINADSHYFEHNTRSLLQMNFLKRVQAGSMGVRAGLFTRDEWRSGENMPMLPEGKGEQVPDIQKAKPDGGADKGESDQPRGPAADGPDSTDDEDRSLATRRFVFELTGVARHKSRSAKSFCGLLDSGFVNIRERMIQDIESDELCDALLESLRSAESAPVQELKETVHQLCVQFEKEYS